MCGLGLAAWNYGWRAVMSRCGSLTTVSMPAQSASTVTGASPENWITAAANNRTDAELAADRCLVAAPEILWLHAIPHRVPPVSNGAPSRPLLLAVATIAVTNSAAALVFELVVGLNDRHGLEMALVAADRTTAAATDGIRALTVWDRERNPEYAFPRSWHGIVDRLGVRVLDEMRPARDAAESLGGTSPAQRPPMTEPCMRCASARGTFRGLVPSRRYIG